MANTETDGPPFGLTKNDAEFLKNFHSRLKDLRSIIISNIEFYQRGKSSVHSCYYAAFCILLERTQVLEPQVIQIVPRLSKYDFSEEVQANGYRSFISIVNRCCLHLLQLCRHICVNKTSLLFRSAFYLKELEAYVDVLGQLMAFLGYLQQLMSVTPDGNLFLTDDGMVGDDLLLEVEMLNTDCFYGRCLGFQYCESVKKVLQAVLVAMATFSECYEESSQVMQVASSVLGSSKYMWDEDLRARQVVDITRTADIKFCKAFWSIPESPMLHGLRSFTFPHVDVSEVLLLPAEDFELPSVGPGCDFPTVKISPPCAHTGPGPVSVRLISHVVREGMQVTRHRFRPRTGGSKMAVLGKSSGLLFHCHGGGFVAQSSQAHEDYLRVWARELEMPILSVDYSLAPEQPFPRALEETFYAYAWALKYPEKLGWTGERICFAGDSAGGNLVLTTALRAVSFQIRVPDGIMAAYPTTMVQYEPSPARLMSMIDPLLPVGILTRVLAAYSGIADKFSSALATPIFCNPAKYETWEVVETAEVVEESSSLPTNEIAECNGHSPNEKCSCNHVELTANQNLSAQSMFFAQQNRCGTEVNAISVNSRCSSIDTITDDEFVVYDLDGTQTSMKLKQTDGSNCDNKIESALPRYSIQSSSTNMSILPDQCSKDHALNCAEAVGNKVLDMASGKDLNQVSVVESEDTNSSKEQHPKLKNTDQRFFGSFEEMMATLNSNITVQENCDDSATATKDLYAVCQELLHEDSGRLSVDMKSTICKSIEDMDELGDQAPIESFVCEEQQAFNTEPKNEEIDIRNKRRKINQKQPSLSGANSSWIHGDTDIERGREPVNSDIGLERGSEVVCNDKDIERESKAVPSDTDKERSHESVQRDQMGEGDNSKPRTHSNIETYITNTPAHTDMLNSKKRTLSLDLPVSFHPGQKSQISKSPDKMLLSTSDFSPKLSPGARKCTPKLYSVQRKIAQSPIHLFRKLPIVKNYFMSPLLAPDEFLMGLPEVHLAACHFDPLLDDSVMFARKLQSLGRPVTLKVYDYLPHGFLSFGHASKEASLASNGCLDMIKQVLIKLERF